TQTSGSTPRSRAKDGPRQPPRRGSSHIRGPPLTSTPLRRLREPDPQHVVDGDVGRHLLTQPAAPKGPPVPGEVPNRRRYLGTANVTSLSQGFLFERSSSMTRRAGAEPR